MANTYTLIDKSILTGNQTSITFSSIPSTYTDLQIVASVRTDRSGEKDDDVVIKPNNSASNAT